MEVVVGEVYRHFKGNLYRVLNIAKHTETGENLVIYQDMQDDTKIYARPYEMFVSKVDKDKYPDVTAEFRFTPYKDEIGQSIDPDLSKFLDTNDLVEKIDILRNMRFKVTDRMLDTMAFSMDLSLNDGSTDEKYRELLSSLSFRERMEGGRLRR